ncbi:LOW QUALITY PROTEIN: probable glutamate receptor [Panulirus ornatus]|uniref:LOW QUALITY PROTEIN: probable glutamate receptor n=1 Tax=Panulirus ornatus TaxID=150431 RepID=UPI003A8B82BF
MPKDWRNDLIVLLFEVKENGTSAVAGVLKDVLAREDHPRCSVILFTDGSNSASHTSSLLPYIRTLGNVGVFQITYVSQGSNMTHNQLSQLIDQATWLRQLSWCVTVVVVSDDPAFLAAFAERSLKGRLLVWPTKLLAVTHLPLVELRDLHSSFSMMNAMLIIVDKTEERIRCSVHVHLPYSPTVWRVAFWTPQRGLTIFTQLPLFPEKFAKFLQRPALVAVTEVNPINKIIYEDDPEAAGAQTFMFTGPMPKLMDYLSSALNFSYSYVRPPDRSWGMKRKDGSWSGMMGMVVRKEVDIGVGPFGVSAVRAEVVDFTGGILIDYWRILGARGRTEVDPWGFLLPFAPLVWLAILVALVVGPSTIFLLSSGFSLKTDGRRNWLDTSFSYVRILLQQDCVFLAIWRWERLVLGVWMMTTLVLTRSYAGNLMSLLAVRHIPEPYQSLRDVVDDSSVNMIWQTNTSFMQFIHSAQSGIYREIAESEKIGRIVYRTQSQFPESINTLVRRGDHVLMEVEVAIKVLMARDFTHTELCSFYKSKGEFLPTIFSMIAQKDSPIIPAINKRITAMTEAGLFFYWMKVNERNSTICYQAPSKITVRTPLSLSNIWMRHFNDSS